MKIKSPTRKPTAQELIEHFKMRRIPHEGAWFAPTYRSADEAVERGGIQNAAARRAYSAIYCLETHTDFSAMHRLAADEIWNYYGGSPLELLLLHPDARGETIVIGPDVLSGHHPQFLVPRGVWQGSHPWDESADAYTFFGTTVVPGFEYSDYEPGSRADLQALYPAFAERIAALTRSEI